MLLLINFCMFIKSIEHCLLCQLMCFSCHYLMKILLFVPLSFRKRGLPFFWQPPVFNAYIKHFITFCSYSYEEYTSVAVEFFSQSLKPAFINESVKYQLTSAQEKNILDRLATTTVIYCLHWIKLVKVCTNEGNILVQHRPKSLDATSSASYPGAFLYRKKIN